MGIGHWLLACGLAALRPLDCLVDIFGVVCRLEAYSVHSCVDAWEWVHGRRLRPCWRRAPGTSSIIKTALVACCDHAVSPFHEPSASSVRSSSTAQACGAASPRKSKPGNRQDRHTRDVGLRKQAVPRGAGERELNHLAQRPTTSCRLGILDAAMPLYVCTCNAALGCCWHRGGGRKAGRPCHEC
jgi:hypothetical protein